jgi:enoyl-CoA hydratase/carnithine racemase
VQTPRTWAALAAVGAELPAEVRVVILRAEGPSFSAGLDRAELDRLPELAALDDGALDALIASYQAAFTWWRRADLVSIAAVQGHAVGAGFQLALACDLRVLADDAQLSMRETSLGLVPDLGGTATLVEIVGRPRALEICLTGRSVPAAEAVALRLGELVVPRAQLDAAACDLAAAVLAAPSGAVVATKQLLSGASGRSYDAQCAAERQAQAGRLRALQD